MWHVLLTCAHEAHDAHSVVHADHHHIPADSQPPARVHLCGTNQKATSIYEHHHWNITIHIQDKEETKIILTFTDYFFWFTHYSAKLTAVISLLIAAAIWLHLV